MRLAQSHKLLGILFMALVLTGIWGTTTTVRLAG